MIASMATLKKNSKKKQKTNPKKKKLVLGYIHWVFLFLFSFSFFPILQGMWTAKYPQEDLAKFGYKDFKKN
jgi:hypothetical protein